MTLTLRDWRGGFPGNPSLGGFSQVQPRNGRSFAAFFTFCFWSPVWLRSGRSFFSLQNFKTVESGKSGLATIVLLLDHDHQQDGPYSVRLICVCARAQKEVCQSLWTFCARAPGAERESRLVYVYFVAKSGPPLRRRQGQLAGPPLSRTDTCLAPHAAGSSSDSSCSSLVLTVSSSCSADDKSIPRKPGPKRYR